MTAVSLLRTVSLAAGRRLVVRGQRESRVAAAGRQERPATQIEPVASVADVPVHSDACFCAVELPAYLPCWNCRRDCGLILNSLHRDGEAS